MATYTVEAEGNIPFASTQTAEITLPEFGRYIIVPEFKGMESPRGRTYATVVCSDIAAGAFGHTDGCTATVVDFLSGASLEGATLTLYPWRRNSAPTVLKGTTDADGFLSFASDLHGNIGASKGGDRFGTRFSVYPFGMRDTSTTYQAEFQTALALYRPGDTVDFSAILTVKKVMAKVDSHPTEVLPSNLRCQRAESRHTDTDHRCLGACGRFVQAPICGCDR